MTIRWIGALVVLGCLLTALVAWSLVPTRNATAAPLQKPVADKGVIWVYYPKADNTATLTAYTPDGKKGEEIALRDGDCYLGLTPDGRKIAFVGKGGKLAKSPKGEGLTVHLRDIADAAEGADTGIPAGEDYSWPVWSPDMKRALYGRVTSRNGVIPRTYKYALVDLTTKKETPLDIPGDFIVTRWSPDGEWLLGNQWTNSPHWRRYDLADGKLHTIIEKRIHYYADLSPDGKTLIAYGQTKEGVIGDHSRRAG